MARRLREVTNGPQLRREMTKALRQGTRPAVVGVRAAALSLPAKHPSSGLRRDMAAAVSVQVRTTGNQAGVRVRIPRRRLGSKAALPRVTNRGVWRHPVFGDRGTWVTQTSQRGWFDRAAAAAAPQVRRALDQVIDDLDRKLSRH
jgi:hypothetical protein